MFAHLVRTRRRWLAVGAGSIAVLALLGAVVRVPYRSTVQPLAQHTVGELHGTLEAGQLFESVRPVLSGVAFQMATFGNRKNTEDVLFELRERVFDTQPIRVVRVNARVFRDHQWHTFRFSPIGDALGKTYYASLKSPNSRPGNAVTVDLAVDNPYEKASASSLVVLRTRSRSPAAVEKSVKPRADLTFAVVHHIRLRERLRLAALGIVRDLRADPRRWRLLGATGGAALVLSLGTVGLLGPLKLLLAPRVLPFTLGALLTLGLFLRFLFAANLPYTNDEGAALYDAWTVRHARLPGGDGLLKAPGYLAVLAAGLALLGPTLQSGRIVSIVASLLTVFPLIALARRLSTSRALPVVVGSLWLLAAGPAIFGVYTHAQSVQLLWGTLALAAFARSLDSQTNRPLPAAILAGVAGGLALATRRTSIALVLPALLLIWMARSRPRHRLLVSGSAVLTLATVLAVVAFALAPLYGSLGLRYASGFDLARVDPRSVASAEEQSRALVKGVLPLLREGLPLLLLAGIGLGGTLELLARRRGPPKAILHRAVWLLPLAVLYAASRFLRENERGEYFTFGLWLFWVASLVALTVIAILPRRVPPAGEGNTESLSALPALLLPLAWFLGAFAVYASWIKFTANYLAEFLPSLTLLAAVGVIWVRQYLKPRLLVGIALSALLAVGSATAVRQGLAFPHTGTFDLSSLAEAAAVLRAHAPPNEPILTAAVAVPILSGHQSLLDIAHPTHYAYGYIEPAVRNIYLPSAAAMVRAAIENTHFAVIEKLTAFSYFREYPEIERLVAEEFEPIVTIENLSNPITILKRK